MANAWLVLAAGDDRQHGGNDGYQDDPASTYRWDNTVPNHAALKTGDVIALWNKRWLIGASVIESIEEADAFKKVYRCSNCGKAHIKRRKRLSPAYRCFGCSTNFEEPTVEDVAVHTYATQHDVGWVDLAGTLTGTQLRQLCESPKSQLSLRALQWSVFRDAVESVVPGSPLALVDARGTRVRDGHGKATVRVRRGQGAFRKQLLDKHGSVCAFTGPAPAAALEACHLYSYAEVGQHDDNGGLLLRRDLHRLFDIGLFAVDPRTSTVDVHPDLTQYPEYASFHGRRLLVDASAKRERWLRRHWTLHRV